jgi:zinc transport system ATP-binding protein
MSEQAPVTPALCFQRVDFAYAKEPVLTHVDFDIEAGERIGVVGPNGGGKTTLLKLILGLLKPKRGTIKIFGKAPEQRHGSIGYVPQHGQFDPLFPISVLDVVRMGCLGGQREQELSRAQAKAAALQALDHLKIADLAKRPFTALSGGQRQAVLIARALVVDAQILLLDEPTSNIDAAGRERILEQLEQLPQDLTQLTVSHDLSLIAGAVPKVLCVNREVHLHPTEQLNADHVRALYEGKLGGLCAIRHDHEDPASNGQHQHR